MHSSPSTPGGADRPSAVSTAREAGASFFKSILPEYNNATRSSARLLSRSPTAASVFSVSDSPIARIPVAAASATVASSTTAVGASCRNECSRYGAGSDAGSHTSRPAPADTAATTAATRSDPRSNPSTTVPPRTPGMAATNCAAVLRKWACVISTPASTIATEFSACRNIGARLCTTSASPAPRGRWPIGRWGDASAARNSAV
ncbi:Uncharacterised protein [Mycobacteroides abscessus subsp. abscessus]|nr:Uncharacterised protein [Mycobacteroides abscessus subsp. abscessus]SIK22979.1 Uncharacterised protein [Mycobacteroides abscessus subsp. abscessus]